MKKIISLILILSSLLLIFVSCKDDSGDLLSYKYDYDLSEYIELSEYKNLPANAYKNTFSEERLQQEVQLSLMYYARLVEVTDRASEAGDTLYLNYTIKAEGDNVATESKTNATVLVGGSTFPAEVDKLLRGVKAGDEIEASVENSDGKVINYDIHVVAVCENELPEYNDEFVRAYLGFNSVKEYEQSIRDQAAKEYKNNYYQMVVGQVWSKIVEDTKLISFPENTVTAMYDDIIESNKAYAQMQSMTFASFIQRVYEMTEEEFYKYAMEESEARIKDEMICYAIARAENITITEEEYNERVTDYAINNYGLESREELEELYDKNALRHAVLMDKVKEVVADMADITYIEITAE